MRVLKKIRKIKLRKTNFAFTLAEVLIVLTIIGVIAALTIPALVTKFNNHSEQTHAKKMYSVIQEAVDRAKMDNGNSYKGLTPDDITAKLSVIKTCNTDPFTEGCVGVSSYESSVNNNRAYWGWAKITAGALFSKAVVLNSGETVIFGDFAPLCNAQNETNQSYCGIIQFDINGLAKPNSWGHDYFSTYLFPDGIGLKPAGDLNYDVSYGDHTLNTCTQPDGTAWSGWSCMAKVLLGENY